jgi:hypothetical protein
MTGPSSPSIARRHCLTCKGQVAVAGIALREAVASLPELEQYRLLMELQDLVARYVPAVEAAR